MIGQGKGIYSIILLLCVTCLMNAGTATGGSYYSSGSTGIGGGSVSGSTYKSAVAVGGIAIGDMSSLTTYRNYSGLLPLQVSAPSMLVIDNNMSFIDESPVSSDIQTTTKVTFKVTLQSTSNKIASVYYSFSNAGVDGLSTAGYQYDVSTDTVITADKKIRFSVTFPNSSGQSLSVSGDNYIKWFAKNDAGADAPPAIYRIRVRSGAVPAFAITQPDTRTGFASIQPQIEASVSDTDAIIDSTTVRIVMVKAGSASPVIDIRSSAQPDIYNTAANLVSYKYSGTPLSENCVYTLTISASDKAAVTEYSTSASFTVKGGAIADLVPYPSPFDPKQQQVTIRYVLNKPSSVSINLYDMAGRLVKNVIDGEAKAAGINEDKWNGTNYAGNQLANGVYFCEVSATDSDGEHRRYTSLAIFGK